MELQAYAGPLFHDDRPHADLGALLRQRDTLIELTPSGPPAVVLGVPHHAAVGVDRIAEHSASGGRVADENAVLYALVCLAELKRRGIPGALVVAAHATDHDPNKHAESPYCLRVLRRPRAALLVECHGAGATAPHDLEVSAGRNGRSHPLEFGRLLAGALGAGFHVAAQTRPGERGALVLDAHPRSTPSVLRFPALRTRSLHAAGERGIHAIHVEAKPRFRRSAAGTGLPRAGEHLGHSLARAIAAYLTSHA